MRRAKKCGLFVCSALSLGLLCGGVFAQNAVKASAAEATFSTFSLTEGMSVRTDSPVGLRFTTNISTSEKGNLPSDAVFGTLILPKTILGDNELTVDTAKVLNIECKKWVDETDATKDTYYSTLVGESLGDYPQALYNTYMVARSYVKYTQEGVTKVEYSTNTVSRSIAYVAVSALNDGIESTLLSDIVTKALAEKSYSLTVTKGTANKSAYIDGEKAILTAEENGKEFSHWEKNGENVGSEKQITVAVTGNDAYEAVYKPSFVSVPANVKADSNATVEILPATSEDGVVTWQTALVTVGEDFSKGGVVMEAVTNDQYTAGIGNTQSPTSIVALKDTATRITYTVTNEKGLTSTAEQYIVCHDKALSLNSIYPSLYENATVSGNLTKVNGDYLLGDNGGLRLSGVQGVEANGKFTAQNVSLGENNNVLRFVVYNAGTADAWYSINNVGCSIAPGAYVVFNGIRYGYAAALQGWGLISSDKKLLPLTFKATCSTAPIDLRIGYFTVNESSFAEPTLTTSYEDTYTIGSTINVKESVSGAETYTWRILQEGEEVATGTQETAGEYVLNALGDYTVEYVVSYTVGEIQKSKTISAEFTVTAKPLVFSFIPENKITYTQGYTTVTPATCENGTVTWKAEVISTSLMTGSDVRTDLSQYGYTSGVNANSPASVWVYEWHGVRITYTATDDLGNTITTYQTITYLGDRPLVSSKYADFYSAATYTGDLQAVTTPMFGDVGGIRLYNGTNSATGTFTNKVNLGVNNNSLDYLLHNNSDKSVKLSWCGTSSAGEKWIPAHTTVRLHAMNYGYEAAVLGWNLVNRDGKTLNALQFSATCAEGGEVDLLVSRFYVNNTSFTYEEEYTVGNAVDIAANYTYSTAYNWTISYGETEDTLTEVATGTEATAGTYTLDQVGVYKIVYTSGTVKGTATFTVKEG